MKVKKNKTRFTEEQKKFLIDHLKEGKTAREVGSLFYQKYGRELSINYINVFRFRNKVGKNKYYDSKVTADQKKYLMKYLPYHNNKETIQMFKDKYGVELKDSTLKNFRHWYHIERKYKHHSENYGKPIEKDLYNEIQDNRKGTMVRIGTRKYQYKRRYVWEQYYGRKIPKGYEIIHLDGNKENYDINNLALVKKGVRIYALKKDIDLKSKDIIDTTKLCYRLEQKIKNKTKEGGRVPPYPLD